MTAAATAGSGRKPRARPAGPVLKAARVSLQDLDSEHEASALLVAVAERLARDVDEVEEARDRIAAVKVLLQVVNTLVPPPPADEGGGGRGGDDPFDIGDVPPGVEHPPER